MASSRTCVSTSRTSSCTSRDPVLAAIAEKGVAELRYQRDHAARWVLRLGDGTAESHRRAQDAVDAIWPLTADLCSPTDVELRLRDCGIAVDPREVAEELRDVLTHVVEQATLRVPAWPEAVPPRGRLGEHGPEVAELVGTLQSLARQHPAATW